MEISVEQFLSAVNENAARIHAYRKGGTGKDGTCDCVGLLIGALLLAGIQYSGIHGSNYFARNWTIGLKHIASTSELIAGDVVFKSKMPGDPDYDLPEKYSGSSWKNDFYHIGVVTSVTPLRIAHCSSGGMHYDSKLGKWSYFGRCRNVQYEEHDVKPVSGPAIVDVPNDGTLNVRSKPSSRASRIDTIREGTEVDVLAESAGWAKIRYAKEGYVLSKYLKHTNQEEMPHDMG